VIAMLVARAGLADEIVNSPSAAPGRGAILQREKNRAVARKRRNRVRIGDRHPAVLADRRAERSNASG
jgi:hypothetical protein